MLCDNKIRFQWRRPLHDNRRGKVVICFGEIVHQLRAWFLRKSTHKYKHISQLIEAVWRIYASVNFPSLAQIMACRLVGAKPLSKPMLEYC